MVVARLSLGLALAFNLETSTPLSWLACSLQSHSRLTIPLSLLQYLVDKGLYEEKAEAELREDVLGQLDELVTHWVKAVTEASEMGEHFVAEAKAKIFTFGSYRLGVHGPGKTPLTLPFLDRTSKEGGLSMGWGDSPKPIMRAAQAGGCRLNNRCNLGYKKTHDA